MRGFGFDSLPDELVMGFNPSSVLSAETGYSMVFLVEKNSNSMVFEVQNSHTFTDDTTLTYLASPFAPPRSFLEYRLFY